MKKLFLTCIILFAWCVQAESQKYLNFFQDDIVILKILASDVDSINITETEPYTINLWYEGTVFQSYASEEVDSIIVTDERGEPLSYLGVVGFNSELYTKQVGLLSQSTVSQYESFINNLPKKDGTILYYAVDSALNVTEGANIKTQLSSAYFITFTDGLDQGSIMLNPKYSSSNSYLNDISKHIEEAQVSGLLVNAYAIGLRGKDVTDVNMFKRNLNSLASSEDKAFEVRDISELRSRLQEIANKIISINTRQTISVKIPGIDNGTTIRFTFDGNDASNSQLYIEGTLNLSDYSLHDVTYQGIKARSGSIVQGTQDGIFLTFTFTGMRREDETGTLNTNYVKHFYRLPSSTIWQVNSEFTPTNNIQRNVSYSGTSIMLVLDCSSSLGSDFSKMQSYAKEFINMVAKNAMPYSFGTPRNVLAVMDSTNLTIDISWDAVTYADYYMVYRNNSNSSYSNYTLIADSVASTSWKDERPMSGNNYYKVYAVGLGLTSEKSNGSNSVSCSLDAPKNISGQLVLNGDSLAIRMKWDAVKYAEHYKIYRSNNYRNGYELMEDSVTNISWMDASPLAGSNYYKICAVSRSITSSESNYCEVKYALGIPQNINAVQDSVKMAIHVTWDKVDCAQRYKIYRCNGNSYNSNYELIADSVISTSWRDDAPMKGNNYYKVSAAGYGLTSSQSNASNVVNCSLDAPKNISGELVQNGDSLAIQMKWDAVKYAEHYKIYRSNNYRNGYELMEDSVTNISWMDASPLAGSNYYKICAVSRSITSSESNYCEVKCALDVPKNVKATLGDVNLVVNVTWDKVNVAQWYMVYRSNSSNSGYKLLVDSVASTTWRDDAPMKGNNYYKVSAAGYGLTSSQSNASNVVNCSLDAPKNIKATFDDSTFSISVTWDEVKYAKHYKIYRSNSSNSDYGLLADSVASTSWKDFAPMKGKNYYKVYAVCNEIISAASNYATANCPLELDAPKNLVGEMILNDGKLVINVKWDSTKNAEYYKVYRSSNNNSGFTLIADAIMYSSFIDESPLSGINYYRVRAFGHGLSSPDSNTSEGISFSLPAPEHVTGNLIQDGDSPIINIAWDSVKYAKSYNVYRCNLSHGEFVLLAEGISSTFWRDEVPLKGRNYYKVSASGYGLTSPLSAAVKIANYANTGQIAINTIISDGDMQPIFVGGYINNYNEDYVTKKGVIVSKQIGDLIINENSKFEKIGEDRTPKDLRVIDCTGINEEEFMCGLLDLEGNTDYYVRAFAITDEGEVLYGDEEIVHSQTFSRYKGRADYANVYYYNSYTLFDLVTDEIIDPNDGFYYSTNENPTKVGHQIGTGSNRSYKFATEWNYKLWYYHSGHCDNNKKVSIPVMRMNDGKLEITKAEADKDKTVSIFYCVDGDGRHPENFSEKYTSPINVAKGSAVYCYAISSDGYISYTNRYIVF